MGSAVAKIIRYPIEMMMMVMMAQGECDLSGYCDCDNDGNLPGGTQLAQVDYLIKDSTASRPF